MDAMYSRGDASPPSSPLHEQLLQLLQQQVALEEKLVTQRALMQRIAEGFTVLHAWAVRSAQHDISLHDLLIVSAYSSELVGATGATLAEEEEVVVQRRRAESHGKFVSLAAESTASNPSNPSQKQRPRQCDMKQAYGAFIRARVADEGCAEPDSAMQFHTLTADSFYLLLPHLTELLRELGSTSSACALRHYSSSTTTGGGAAAVELAPPPLPATAEVAWCASATRVIRFLELGLRHFPEVLDSSPLRPKLLRNLAHLRESSSGSSAALHLSRRADTLWANLQRLGAINGTDVCSNDDDGPH